MGTLYFHITLIMQALKVSKTNLIYRFVDTFSDASDIKDLCSFTRLFLISLFVAFSVAIISIVAFVIAVAPFVNIFLVYSGFGEKLPFLDGFSFAVSIISIVVYSLLFWFNRDGLRTWYFDKYKSVTYHDWKKENKMVKEDSLIYEMYRAFKDKTCVRIEVV